MTKFKQYIIAIRIDGKNELFSFKSEKDRQRFINLLPHDIQYMTTESIE